jgi:hypothetical protein
MDDEAYYLSQIPKPEPTRLGAKKASTLIQRVIQQKGYAAVKSAEVLQEAWEKIVGPGLSAQSRVGRVERGALCIYVANPVIKTELEFMRSQALRELQKQAPEYGIRSLKFRVQKS